MTTPPPIPLSDDPQPSLNPLPGPLDALLALAVEVRAMLGIVGRAMWPRGRPTTVPGALLLSYRGEAVDQPGTQTVSWATTRLGPIASTTETGRLGSARSDGDSSGLRHQYRRLRVKPGAEAAVSWGIRACYRLAQRQRGELDDPDDELVVEPVHHYRLDTVGPVPATLGTLIWNPVHGRYLQLTGATRVDSGGSHVPVTVLDTDIDESVLGELTGAGIIYSGLDLYAMDQADVPDEKRLDESPRHPACHGTLVVAIIRKVAPNTDIRYHRIADTDTNNTNEWVILEAFDHALDEGTQVINLSATCLENRTHRYRANIYRSFSRKLNELNKKGIVVVASTGNHDHRPKAGMGFPARHPAVVAIGSVTSTGTASSFSRHGPKDAPPTVEWWLAPGGEANATGTVTECLADIGQHHAAGTSFATAFASALIARDLAPNPDRHELLTRMRQHPNTADLVAYDPERHGLGILRLSP